MASKSKARQVKPKQPGKTSAKLGEGLSNESDQAEVVDAAGEGKTVTEKPSGKSRGKQPSRQQSKPTQVRSKRGKLGNEPGEASEREPQAALASAAT